MRRMFHRLNKGYKFCVYAFFKLFLKNAYIRLKSISKSITGTCRRSVSLTAEHHKPIPIFSVADTVTVVNLIQHVVSYSSCFIRKLLALSLALLEQTSAVYLHITSLLSVRISEDK